MQLGGRETLTKFRLSMLLSSGALVLSEGGLAEDEREYKGAVRFSKNLSAMREDAADIARWSASERSDAASRAEAAFRDEFEVIINGRALNVKFYLQYCE